LSNPTLSTSSLSKQKTADGNLHAEFLAVLERIERHANVYFRHVKYPHRKEEMIAETVALSWSWFVRLHQRGKDPSGFISILATHAARHIRLGRRLCGQEKTKDVLSPLAQTRFNFTTCPLPDGSSLNGNVFDEALRDNTQTPPDEQAAFRLDFPAWRLSRCERDRRLIDDLMIGERTKDVSRKHGLTQGRISQLRREFHEDWTRFCGEIPDGTPLVV